LQNTEDILNVFIHTMQVNGVQTLLTKAVYKKQIFKKKKKKNIWSIMIGNGTRAI